MNNSVFATLVTVLLAVGCYRADVPSCTVSCEVTADCPGELSCSAQKLCSADIECTASAPFTRVFHTLDRGSVSTLYTTNVNEGVASPTVAMSLANFASRVVEFQTTEDGEVVVFIADGIVDGTNELFLVRPGATPNQPIRISATHGSAVEEQVIRFELSRDGRRVVYAWGTPPLAGNFTATAWFLVDLSVDTPGPPIALGTSLPPNGQPPPDGFGLGTLSPDGNQFMFVGLGPAALYVADLTISSPTNQLVISFSAGSSIATIEFSPTGDRAAFVADVGALTLFVVDIATLRADQIGTNALVGFGGYPLHVFSNDGKRLAFLANPSGKQELFVSDMTSAAPYTPDRVNAPLVAGGHVDDGTTLTLPLRRAFAFTADTRYLVYQADQVTNDRFELFATDVSSTPPGPAVLLNGSLPVEGDVFAWTLAPDGSGLAYTANQNIVGRTELFYVDLRAEPSPATVVNPPLVPGGHLATSNGLDAILAISRDGRRLIYGADQELDDRVELYLADVSTGPPDPLVQPPTRLQLPTNPMARISHAVFSRDSNVVVWSSNSLDAASLDVWLTDVAGSTPGVPQKINVVTGTPTVVVAR